LGRGEFIIDGFISNDFSSITVDLNLMGRYENRYRFTLAHEIGHMILHKNVYNQMDFSSTEEWLKTITTFDAIQYGYMETQANKFAGLVLVPKYFLKEKHEEAVKKVEAQGFDRKKNHEIFNQYVCRWLGQEFNVAEKVIKIRLEADNLV
jgi:Zn-dependent peptidase ImmA (M78 family)